MSICRFPAIFAIIGCLLAICGQTLAEESVFPDKNLEAVVRQYVFEKRNSDEPLTEKDVENISTIEGKEKEIKDLTGLDKCVSLALLDLEGNAIADLKPIKSLTNLQSVNLSRNQITEVDVLSELVKLQYLHLAQNQIADLAPLAKMENMRSLYLSDNKLEDIKPLAGLTKIWSLYLDGNQVTNLEPLKNLQWLSSLDLRGNGIESIEALSELTELRFLILDNNRLTDLAVLLKMAEKDASGDQRFAPFWNLFLGGNPLSDDAKTNQVERLRELGAKVSLEPIGSK
jgi:internalin A